MLSAPSFFELSSYEHIDLIGSGEYVWFALKNLKSYLEDQQYDDLDRALIPDGEPVNRTLVFHDGNLEEVGNCTIEKDNITKGGLKVFRDNKLLTGASIIMAGAVFTGGRIRILLENLFLLRRRDYRTSPRHSLIIN